MSFSCHTRCHFSSLYAAFRHFYHLTFNQVVRGSNPRCFTHENRRKSSIYAGLRRFCVLESKALLAVFIYYRYVIFMSLGT